MTGKPTTIDEYLAALPEDKRAPLVELRQTIRAVAPDAVESVSYGLPSFKYRGRPLIYFGAAKTHCAIYGQVSETLRDELSAYDTSKGTIRFPPDRPLPATLVKMIVRVRIEEIEATQASMRRSSGRRAPA